MEILIRESPQAGAKVGANVVRKIIQSKDKPVLGLATGDTPLRMYKELIRMHQSRKLSFQNCTTFNLDEYGGCAGKQTLIPFLYDEQFFRLTLTLTKIMFIFRMVAQKDLRDSCRKYEKLIDDAGGIDLQVLGIGSNGHIGFNEPTGSLASRTWVKILSKQTIQDNSIYFDKLEEVPRHVVTMGIATIMESRHCLLMANGAKKADAIRKMIEGPISASCPASILQMHPHVTIILDDESSYLLTFKDHYKWIEKNKLDWQLY